MNQQFYKQSGHHMGTGPVLLLIVLLLFSGTPCTAQSGDLVAVDKVASDFTKLLQRPVTDFRPSFQVTRTDSVVIEKGFIYSEANEKIPILIYKPVHTSLKSFPVVICL